MCTTTRAGPGISWGWRVGSPVVRRPGTMFAPGVASSRKSFPIRHLSVTHGDACSRAFGEKPERPSLCRASAGPCKVRKGAWPRGSGSREPSSAVLLPASRFTRCERCGQYWDRRFLRPSGAKDDLCEGGLKRLHIGRFRRRICLETARCGAFSAARPGFSTDPEILENPGEKAELGVWEAVKRPAVSRVDKKC